MNRIAGIAWKQPADTFRFLFFVLLKNVQNQLKFLSAALPGIDIRLGVLHAIAQVLQSVRDICMVAFRLSHHGVRFCC